MAAGSAQLNRRGGRSVSYAEPAAKPKNRGAARPAYQPYEPPSRKGPARAAPKPLYEEDYHPVTPLKILTPAEIRAITLVVFVITAIAMGIIFLSAQAAVAQKEINDLRKGIAQVDDDIANLKIEIEQSQNMQLIKERASAELGMKEPSFEQYVYVDELPVPQSDFGRYIKERAYGGARSQAEEPEAE